jgi:hypothetical protein
MIKVTINPECLQFMRDMGIAPDRARVTINDRHQWLITGGRDRIIATHWFGDDDIVLVESLVKEKGVNGDDHQLFGIIGVEAQLVISLRSVLPGGTFTRETKIEQILAVVTESFGCPIIGYPGFRPTKLYSGPWHTNKFSIQANKGSGSIWHVGSTDQHHNRCELVWAFNVERYRQWAAECINTALVRRVAIPSRIALESRAEALKTYVKDFQRNFPEIPPTANAIQYGLAMNVLKEALGSEWVRRNLVDASSTHPFRSVGVTGPEGMKAQAQTAELGEMVFNLQTVPGFEGRLEALKTNDLTSTLAELYAAKLLVLSELPLSFVEPSGKKGFDYEAKISLPSGHTGTCEVKSKHEDTQLTRNTILNSLKTAGSQAPPDAPLIVFLKIPDHWLIDPSVKDIAKSATDKFFRDYSRVIAVVFFWEEWPVLPNGFLGHFWKHKEIINEQSRLYDERNTYVMRSLITQPGTKSWVRFAELLGETAESGSQS